MGLSSSAIETLVSEIKNFVKKTVKDASFDLTRPGTIASVLGDGKYAVKINGVEHTAEACTSDVYNIGDSVLVMFVQNSGNKKYITGKSGGAKPTLQECYVASATAPENTKLLWIDTNADTGGLKYYNGSAWVALPVSYT